MPKLTFYPLGNADTCLIDLADGRKVLFDFSDERNPDDKTDKRIDLTKTLRDDLKAGRRDGYEVLAITHLDDDHTHKADEFFYLDHADKYQKGTRTKFKELWVPAAVIVESRNDLKPGAQAIQAEARHRLKKGYGIRVFSRPESLHDWLEKNGLTVKDREKFITDAGNVVPGFTLAADGLEFFVHSPFAWRQDESTVIDRNGDSLFMQLTFEVDRVQTKALLGSDVYQEALVEIVQITKKHEREHRLEWDVMKLPHHCSYKTLGPDRGDDETKPVEEVAWLFEDQMQRGGIIVSTSKPIPTKGTEDDESIQPPHRQAATYYRRIIRLKDGQFLVTMEHPSEFAPKPIIINIDRWKARVKREQSIGAVALTGVSAPRAG
jgi:hypothetical protein